MQIEGEHRIERDRAAVWAALNDSATLARCIPQCEQLTRAGEHAFDALIAASVGPVRARFQTRLALENLDPPSSYTLTGETRAGPAGYARGSAEVTLEEAGEATLLRYRAGFRVDGKFARLGSRLVAGAMRNSVDAFFACLARDVEGLPGAESGPARERPRSHDQAG